jgi:hypothetical protein
MLKKIIVFIKISLIFVLNIVVDLNLHIKLNTP